MDRHRKYEVNVTVHVEAPSAQVAEEAVLDHVRDSIARDAHYEDLIGAFGIMRDVDPIYVVESDQAGRISMVTAVLIWAILMAGVIAYGVTTW